MLSLYKKEAFKYILNIVRMSERGRNRTSQRSTVKGNKRLLDDYEDPLELEGNILVKNEICPEVLPSDILPDPDEEVFGMVDSHDLVAEHQRMMYGVDMGANDQHSIAERLGTLERKVDFLLNINSKILARVDKICEDVRGGPVHQFNEFPITDIVELGSIDAKIANNRQKYVEIFKVMLKPYGFVKHVERFFDRSVLMQMNYSGCSSKVALSDYNNLNMALYESQKTAEGFTIGDYSKIVREAFIKAKNRVYKSHTRNKLDKKN